MAEDYNFQSPYVYAANNPIRYIDWMGMSASENDDWWVYEETGKLIHTQGDNKPRNFQNCTKIGEDGMFGEAGTETENGDNNAEGFSQTPLTVEDSKELAEEGGYKMVASEVDIESKITSTTYDTGTKSVTQDIGDINITETKVTYVPKNHGAIDGKIVSSEPIDIDYNILTSQKITTEKRTDRVIYGERKTGLETYNLIMKWSGMIGRGEHDNTNLHIKKHPSNK